MKLFIAILSLCLLTPMTVMDAAAASLDLRKAVVIGSGPKIVIEFTDPDCPFCRNASKYFESRSDVTRYVFFLPLPFHPDAKGKVRYILSQVDKAAAYKFVMSGRLDGAPKIEGITAGGIKLQEEHAEIIQKQKVESTPTFMIYGRVVSGFDQRRIEEILGR